MKIYEVSDKKKYLDLLLIGDEQESMIYRYLDGGIMFVLDDGGIKGEAVVCDTGGGVAEIKNIAVLPRHKCAHLNPPFGLTCNVFSHFVLSFCFLDPVK